MGKRSFVPFVILFHLKCLFLCSNAAEEPLVPAAFIFGDSVVYSGDNRNFNYPPYGIDFPNGTDTIGRLTNGYTIADFFDKMLNLPLAPPYLTTKHVDRKKVTNGFNYASPSAGILPETGKARLGRRNWNLKRQVMLFQESVDKYVRFRFKKTAAMSKFLGKSLFLIHVGTNDYLHNYFQPKHYNTSGFKPDEFADFLTKRLARNLKNLYNHGARKFVVFQIAQIGCSPVIVKLFKPQTKCAENVNEMVALFNKKMELQLGHLSFVLRRSYFMTANVFNLTGEILQNPTRYGLKETRSECCQTESWHCKKGTKPCNSRDSYYFWDTYHPTQAVNKIITKECFYNVKVCFPLGVYSLIQM